MGVWTRFLDFNHLLRKCILVATITALTACGNRPVVPVSEIETRSSAREIDRIGGRLIRIVQPGDTLYAIAFESGLSINKLARWNGLSESSRIIAGQKLRLTKPRILPRLQSATPKQGKQNRTTRVTGAPVRSSAQVSGQKPNTASLAKQTSASNSSRLAAGRSIKSNAQRSWIWPTKGKLIQSFKPTSGKQGIDILGEKGQPVYAALDGEVVYAGNGLKGYGNLIIVKHHSELLSAYAHNTEFYVQEGQKVQQNHRIASMGMDNSRRAVLHFQIRKDGKPVDPVDYLP